MSPFREEDWTMPDPIPELMPILTDRVCFVCETGTFRIMSDVIGVECDNEDCGSTITYRAEPIPFLKEESDER